MAAPTHCGRSPTAAGRQRITSARCVRPRCAKRSAGLAGSRSSDRADPAPALVRLAGRPVAVDGHTAGRCRLGLAAPGLDQQPVERLAARPTACADPGHRQRPDRARQSGTASHGRASATAGTRQPLSVQPRHRRFGGRWGLPRRCASAGRKGWRCPVGPVAVRPAQPVADRVQGRLPEQPQPTPAARLRRLCQRRGHRPGTRRLAMPRRAGCGAQPGRQPDSDKPPWRPCMADCLLLAGAVPQQAVGGTAWLCGWSADLSRAECIGDVDPVSENDPAPARPTAQVHGTPFPLDVHHRWTIDQSSARISKACSSSDPKDERHKPTGVVVALAGSLVRPPNAKRRLSAVCRVTETPACLLHKPCAPSFIRVTRLPSPFGIKHLRATWRPLGEAPTHPGLTTVLRRFPQ